MKIIKTIRLNNGEPKMPRKYHYWNQHLLKGEDSLRGACKAAILGMATEVGEEWRNEFDWRGIVIADNIAQIGNILVVPTQNEKGNVFYVETQDVVEDVDEDVHRFYCEDKLIAVMEHDMWKFNFNGEKTYEELKQMVDHDMWVEDTTKKVDAIIAQEVELFATNVKNKLKTLGDVSCFGFLVDTEGMPYFGFKINGTDFVRYVE